MTDHVIEQHGGCLLCAVRAMIEGTPANVWNGGADLEAGASISGVLIRRGQVHGVGLVSGEFIDLWHDETGERVRVLAYGHSLAGELERAAPIVGDRVTVVYLGKREMTTGKFSGRQYRAYRVTVHRGHH
jgi:hypothetical protein